MAISVILAPNQLSCVVQWERFKDGRCHDLVTKDSAWSSHSVFAGTINVYWPTNTNVTWNQIKHKTAYLLGKLLCLSLSPLPIFSAQIKTTTGKVWSIMLFCLPLAYADDILFYSNMRCIVRVNRCLHCTVYTHVVAMFIRAMLHSVTCNDLIGLLKSWSVSGFRCVKLLEGPAEFKFHPKCTWSTNQLLQVYLKTKWYVCWH